MSGTTVGEENHGGVLQEWFGPHWWNDREVALLIIAVFVLLPLVLAKRVGELPPNPSPLILYFDRSHG
jgi:hypothetical protein